MKSKRELRAEAVERLREWSGLIASRSVLMRAIVGTQPITADTLIDLLTDDEPPEGTFQVSHDNGRTFSAPVEIRVEPEPPGDAVGLLRAYATAEQGHDEPGHVMLEREVLEKLADMVERDYVKRQDFEAQHRTLCSVREQRDEAQARVDYLEERHCEWSDPNSLGDGCMLRKDEKFDELRVEREMYKQKMLEALAEYRKLVDEVNELQKKQPYCYDPRNPIETLETVGRYIDELQAKAELRKPCGANDALDDENDVSAASVDANEDSRDNGWYLRYDGYMTSNSNYLRISGFKAARALDNRQNLVFVKFMGGKEADCRVYAPKLDVCENLHNSSKDTQKPRSREADSGNVSDLDGENLHVEQDTREKLEADLETHLYEFGGYCFSSREGHTDNVDTFFDDFVFLLDRQAAITERECFERGVFDLGAHKQIAEQGRTIVEYADRNAELQARVNELEAELCAREKYPDGFMSVNEMRKELGELQAKVDLLDAGREEACSKLADVLRLLEK